MLDGNTSLTEGTSPCLYSRASTVQRLTQLMTERRVGQKTHQFWTVQSLYVRLLGILIFTGIFYFSVCRLIKEKCFPPEKQRNKQAKATGPKVRLPGRTTIGEMARGTLYHSPVS